MNTTTFQTAIKVDDPAAYEITDMVTMLEVEVHIAADGTVTFTVPTRELTAALAEMKRG